MPRADWLMLGLLLVLAAVAAVVGQLAAGADGPPDRLATPSSYHTDGPGAGAVYQAWGRLGFEVDRLRRPLSGARLAEAEALVLLAPLHPLLAEEERELLSWVSDGGRLLMAPGVLWGDGWVNVIDRPSLLEPLLGMRETDDAADTRQAARIGEGLVAGAQAVEGVRRLVTRRGARLDGDRPLRGVLAGGAHEVFWRDGRGVVGLRVDHGRGQVWVLADPYPLSNIGLSEADNAVFAANLAAALTGRPGGGRITFDEYHHGYAQRDMSGVAMVRLILDEGRGWAAAQAALAGLLALFAAAVRFGRPRDPDRTGPPGQKQFIEAAGRLLAGSGGARVAGREIHRHYRRGLCRALHLDEQADEAALARAVAERAGLDIGPALRRTADPRPAALGDAELLRAARTLHRALETLRNGNR